MSKVMDTTETSKALKGRPTPKAGESERFFLRGFGRKAEVAGELAQDYHSDIVLRIKANGGLLEAGDLRIRMAQEFGFCYGVDKAVDFAYETRKQFPDKRIFITTEIIHNPRVNKTLQAMGIQFLSGRCQTATGDEVSADDVVILPAFGVSVQQLEEFKQKGCILVDTTCGSVLNVWKRVEQYAREGFTAIIHGKYYHEETIATSSRATCYEGGQYLVVRDMDQAQIVCEYIRHGGDKAKFLKIFEHAHSPGFDPDQHLQRVGVANQTTMLSSESLAIAQELKKAMITRHGDGDIKNRFRNFDTICSATQDRQDAIIKLVKEGVDIMVVIGGFNSSNTTHLCEIAEKHAPTYHIEDVNGIVSAAEIRHQPYGQHHAIVSRDWLPAPSGKPLTIGVTAGASTPDRVVSDVIEKILSLRGLTVPPLPEPQLAPATKAAENPEEVAVAD